MFKHHQIDTCGSNNELEAAVLESLSRPFKLNIDIVDACNLKCPSCPRGSGISENTKARMSLADFDRLLSRVTSEVKVNAIEPFNWTEPFLHPQLDQFIGLMKKYKIGCVLSTNMSFRKPQLLENVLRHSPAILVSVSGFTQETQSIYHRASNINYIKANLEFISDFRKANNLKFKVEVHCLQFIDNQQDQLQWEKYCNDHDFIYFGKPANSFGLITEETVARLITKPEIEVLSDGTVQPKKYYLEKPSYEFCRFHNRLTVDALGDVYLCCIYWNTEKYKVGNIFELSLKDIQRNRMQHYDCLYCIGHREG